MLKNKLPIFLLLLINFSVCLHAQNIAQNIAPNIVWNKVFGSTGVDRVSGATATADGGYIFVGGFGANDGDATSASSNRFSDIWVIKMSSTNQIEWQKQLGGSSGEMARTIVQTSDGGYVIGGTTGSNDGDVLGNHGGSDMWVVKLSAQGVLIWQKCLGGSFEEECKSLIKTSDGGFLICGSTFSNNGQVSGNHGWIDAWVAKLSASGTVEWQKCFGGSDEDIFLSACQTSDGGYVFAGKTFSYDGDVVGNHRNATHSGATVDAWVVKITALGVLQWQKCLGGSFSEIATSISQKPNGSYTVSVNADSNDGDLVGNNQLQKPIWIVNLSTMGGIQWQKFISNGEVDLTYRVESLIPANDGGYLLIGEIRSGYYPKPTYLRGNYNGWIVKLSSLGVVEWQKVMGGSGGDAFKFACQTLDGNLVLMGETFSNDGNVIGNRGNYDMWIVRLSADARAITGQVTQTNSFCQQLSPPQHIGNGQVKIEKNNNAYFVATDSFGRYTAFVDTGRYTLSAVVPNNWWMACSSTVSNMSNNTRRDTSIVNLSLYPFIICSLMEVQLTTPFLRRCFESTYTVNYVNRGTAAQTDATAELTLDSMLTFVSATRPIKARVGNKITFALGNIGVHQAGQFDVVVKVSCDSRLGQTHCSSITIPKTAACDTIRDTIPSIIAQCNGVCDSVAFLVSSRNTQQNQVLKYTLIANTTLLDTGRFNFNNPFSIKRKADGRTYRLELRNATNQLIAARSLESNATPPSVSTGFVNQFANAVRSPNVSENCTANRGAFDPNEKSSIPTGVGTFRFVEQGSLMSYLVQFQNTGTDTAFTVIVRDTLASLFDVKTLKINATSHPATWQIAPNGVLTVRFDNIQLVDSFTNERKSHGFFTYQIRLKDSIATGTRLENKAAIYFDFNDPIITDAAWHTIGREFLTNCLAKPTVNVIFTGCPSKSITFSATTKNSGLSPTYKWFRNNETTPLSTNANFTLANVTNATKIYCQLTASTELCTETPTITSDTIKITCINTATTEVSPIQIFDVYPNPNRGIFDVKIRLSKPSAVQVSIFNALGQVVKPANIVEVSNIDAISRCDLSASPNGIYIIKITVNGQIFMKKVMIQPQ